MPIELIDKTLSNETFELNYNYSFNFTLNSEIEKNELAVSFPKDFIELLKEKFGEELKKTLKIE